MHQMRTTLCESRSTPHQEPTANSKEVSMERRPATPQEGSIKEPPTNPQEGTMEKPLATSQQGFHKKEKSGERQREGLQANVNRKPKKPAASPEDSSSDKEDETHSCIPVSSIGTVVRETVTALTKSVLEAPRAPPVTQLAGLSAMVREQARTNSLLESLDINITKLRDSTDKINNHMEKTSNQISELGQAVIKSQEVNSQLGKIMQNFVNDQKLTSEKQQNMYQTFLEMSTTVLEKVAHHDVTLSQLTENMVRSQAKPGPISIVVSQLLGLADVGSPKTSKRKTETVESGQKKKVKKTTSQASDSLMIVE